MPFNVGGFNKVLSRAGVQTMGALPQINRKLETSAAAQGLRNAAKIRAAEYGAQIMADRASAERSAARSNAIFGAIGNVVGSGLTAGIKNWQANQAMNSYGQFKPITFDASTAPAKWDAGMGAITDLQNQGFSYGTPTTYQAPAGSTPVFSPGYFSKGW